MEMTDEQKQAMALASARLRLQQQQSATPMPASPPAPVSAAVGDAIGQPSIAAQAMTAVQNSFPGLKVAGGLLTRAGGPAAGQALGALGGPFAPITVPVLGAIGGGLGEMGAEKMEGGGYHPGAILAAAGMGAIPGASLAKAGVGTLALQGAKYGGANLVAKNVETLVDEGRLANTKENLLAGGLPVLGVGVGKFLDTGLNKLNASGQLKALQKAARDKTLAEAQAAGYVIPGSKVNPGPVNTMLESIAGKAATGQEAAIRNQEITDALARKAVGLPHDSPLTADVLKDVRAAASAPYREFSALSANAKKDFEALRQARYDASDKWTQYNATKDPTHKAEAAALGLVADTLENKIEARAQFMGLPDLADKIKAARVTNAKAFEVERALNFGTQVDASKMSKGLGRLTDELDLIARFQKEFPAENRLGRTVPTPGVSKLRGVMAGGLAALGASKFGPAGVVLGGLSMADSLARNGVLSRFGQKLLAQPTYPSAPDFASALAQFTGQAAGRTAPQ